MYSSDQLNVLSDPAIAPSPDEKWLESLRSCNTHQEPGGSGAIALSLLQKASYFLPLDHRPGGFLVMSVRVLSMFMDAG
ncbi:hypothetical protein [Reyranella sp. CPCC 100927]|uniref:hypothetical protein n=1 Tax=Reyranella sp. CPCC 100927 TaxID=2599616 RepID=UPI0011B9211D|nr:hypothetical protein [Reyranella sp. CPCC 100927]TWT12548.1 hypothetical protein FQU96_09750 [Reyranella sp. CPCC 100927]